MKRIIKSLMILLVSSLIISSAVSADGLILTVNGKKAHFYYAQPFIQDGSSLFPLRDLLIALGVKNDNEHIVWNDEEQSVTIHHEEQVLKLSVQQKEVYKDGLLFQLLEVPPQMVNDRVFLPARAVAEALGYNVNYDSITNTVVIQSPREEQGQKNSIPIKSLENAEEAAAAVQEENPLFRIFEINPKNLFYPKTGFMDQKGNIVIAPLPYQNIYEFKDGIALAVIHSGQVNYINKMGEFISKVDFVQGEEFSDGLAAVKIYGKFGFIDKTGSLVIPPQFTSVEPFSDGMARVGKDKRFGYIDKKRQLGYYDS